MRVMIDIYKPNGQVIYHGITDDPMETFIQFCKESDLDTSVYSYEIRKLKDWEMKCAYCS